MVTLADIREAHARLRGVAVRTELAMFPWPEGGNRPGLHQLYLKLENLQPIGAFKIRGAYNKIASLTPQERARGVITYSSGNHGQGVAYAARALGIRAIIVMPENAPLIKRQATEAMGAAVVLVGPASLERQQKAEELVRQNGYVMIPPYNDEKIIAGQGTIGLEILADLPEVDTVLVPVGGGGMISGIATAIKLIKPTAQVIGVEPELASDAQASLEEGRIIQLSADEASQTIADGLRTQSVGPINFEHIRTYVDKIVTVQEEEIRQAIRVLARNPKTVAEPSGAVAVAAFLFHRDGLPDRQATVAVLSGGNIDPLMLQQLESDLTAGSRPSFRTVGT
ncbi:MAG TPA: threonine/serine dehydratase [Terriglobales bacterium]|nr:threonine/serine dehydratase [Terriglobales bacterium]